MQLATFFSFKLSLIHHGKIQHVLFLVSRSLNEVPWIVITVGFTLDHEEGPKRKQERKKKQEVAEIVLQF